MKINDSGYIVFIKKYEEDSLLIKILSKNNGLISGYITHTKKNKLIYQMDNLVKFTWFAKNSYQLGTFKIELIKSNISIFINNQFNLYLIDTMNILLNNILYERYLDNKLFLMFESVLKLLSENESQINILKQFLLLENLLLNITGVGINFNEQTSNKLKLEFISIMNKTDLVREDIFKSLNLLNTLLKNYLLENNLETKYDLIKNSIKNLLKNYI